MYRLLLVDDEKQITEGLKHLLPWAQYQIDEIRTENTYDAALKTGLSWKPHIAIIDVCIRGRYGYDLLRELNRELPELCTVMISGHDEFAYAREAMRQGAVDYLLKPIDPIELGKVLEYIIVGRLFGRMPSVDRSSDAGFDEILQKDKRQLSKLVCKILRIVQEEYSKNLKCAMTNHLPNSAIYNG